MLILAHEIDRVCRQQDVCNSIDSFSGDRTMSSAEQYAPYFPAGLKISIGIPMDNNELFRDWAIVETLEEDIITLQLSRDELPVEVHLVPGIIFDLRVGKEGKGYRCSGFFVEKGEAGELQVHLTGEMATSELREFYRIDVYLPFKYEFSKDKSLDSLVVEWREKKKNRLADEAERREIFQNNRRELLFKTAAGEFDTDDQEKRTFRPPDNEEFNPIDATWDLVNASAINISAGGFRFVTTHDLKIDDLLLVELFIPSHPPRIADCVARVTFKNHNYSIKDGTEHFNIAVHFLLIDDRDRDAIVAHISHIESLRIRQKRQIPLADTSDKKETLSPLKIAFGVVLLVVIIVVVSRYFYDYAHNNTHNIIQDMFQDAVRKYRE